VSTSEETIISLRYLKHAESVLDNALKGKTAATTKKPWIESEIERPKISEDDGQFETSEDDSETSDDESKIIDNAPHISADELQSSVHHICNSIRNSFRDNYWDPKDPIPSGREDIVSSISQQ
jgi:hypothetical protein